jgi:hypothetical protein
MTASTKGLKRIAPERSGIAVMWLDVIDLRCSHNTNATLTQWLLPEMTSRSANPTYR